MNQPVDAEGQQNVRPSVLAPSLSAWHNYLQQREQLTPFLLFVTGFRPLAFVLEQGFHFVQPLAALLNLSTPSTDHAIATNQMPSGQTEEQA